MAVFQAVEAFRLFTGLPADAGRMLRHFRSLTADPARPTSPADPTDQPGLPTSSPWSSRSEP